MLFRSLRASVTLLALGIAVWAVAASRSDASANIPPEPEVQTDIQYTQNEPAEFMDIYSPARATKPMPALVAVHGGGWIQGSRRQLAYAAQHFVGQGYVYCTIDYRFSQVAIYPAQIEDCKCAVRFLRANAAKYHIDPKRIGALGESVGGHLVALLETTGGVKRLEGDGGWQDQSSAVQAVLDWFGPTDMRPYLEANYKDENGYTLITQLLGGRPDQKPDLANDASPITFVAAGDPPILIMHGDSDPVVPLSQSQTFYEALKAAGVDATLKILTHSEHGGSQFTSPENIRLIDDFFRRCLHPDETTRSR